MTLQNDDWRLFRQENYLLGKTLYFKKYSDRKLDADCDHDHCSFCTEKFSEIIPNALTQGYTTEDDYHWICEKCFADFKEMFKWTVNHRQINPTE
jgi:hypothetical protein